MCVTGTLSCGAVVVTHVVVNALVAVPHHVQQVSVAVLPVVPATDRAAARHAWRGILEECCHESGADATEAWWHQRPSGVR
jgi:hypothetical protein